GAACVKSLIDAGAEVVVADRSLQGAQDLARALGPKAAAVQADVSDEGSCRSMVEFTTQKFGRLDIAVNNAGLGNPDRSGVADLSFQEWRRIMSVNLDGVFLSIKTEVPAMIKAGGGSIINIGSIMAVVG